MSRRRPKSATDGGGERGWDEFAPLYDEHSTRLYRVALLLCNGSKAAAEDAVADTFIKVFQVWSQREIEHFFAYARQTLVNEVLAQHRRGAVAARFDAATSGDGRGDLDRHDAVLDSMVAFELLDALPPRERAAIVLRFYEDMQYDQIAESLGVSVGTAKSQVSHGLQKLRTMVEVSDAG